jgi:hypothetical protein
MTGPGIMFISKDYKDSAEGVEDIPNIRDASGDVRHPDDTGLRRPRLEEAADYRGYDSWAEGHIGGPCPVELRTAKYEGRPRIVIVHTVEFLAPGSERGPDYAEHSTSMGFYISESDWEGMKETYGLEVVKRSEPDPNEFEDGK